MPIIQDFILFLISVELAFFGLSLDLNFFDSDSIHNPAPAIYSPIPHP